MKKTTREFFGYAPLVYLKHVNVFALFTCTNAEIVSNCFNIELGAYGLKTYISPDKTAVFIDDEGMCKVLDFFQNKGYQAVITLEHTERIETVIEFANRNKVDLVWSQVGLKKKYYLFKQYGFNGIHLYNLININTVNAAAATLLPIRAAGLTIGGVVALSWSGIIFFSTLENYVPNNMTTLKLVVGGLKFATALPIRCVEWTSNQMIGFVEKVTIGYQLSTNITDAYRLSIGPKLKNIAKFRKPLLGWVINQFVQLIYNPKFNLFILVFSISRICSNL